METDQSPLRLFVGVPVSATDELLRIADKLRGLGRGVRVVEPPQWHVTLAFLGACESDRIPDISRCLDGAAVGASASTLRWQALGAFPNPREPRVIWAGAIDDAGCRALAALTQRVREALAGIGFSIDDRPFLPHLTLARIREPRRHRHNLRHLLDANAQTPLGASPMRRLRLYQSELSESGARYVVRHDIHLPPRA